MQIIQFRAENFKRLKVAEINPDGNVVLITGTNASGKTSVLDAISAALTGGKMGKSVPRPVRDGEESAEIRLDLGEIIVTRKFRADGKSTLEVMSKEGAKFSSPQAMLDTLAGPLSFDPLEFSNQSPKEQVATMCSVVDLPFDPDELAERRQAIYDARTDVNRDVKHLKARLADLPEVDPEAPDVEISISELVERIEEERQVNERFDQATHRLAQAGTAVADASDVVDQLKFDLAEAECALQYVQGTHEEALATLARNHRSMELEELRERLASADEVNKAVRAKQEREELKGELQEVLAHVDVLEEDLKQIDVDKAEALANADMPIDGLSFDEDGVIYQGIPFQQASSAEQLRVSLAMAMAMNPDLRVIRIKDGSLLDEANLKVVEEMATDSDFQVWIERVDDSGQVGVVLSEGEIVS